MFSIKDDFSENFHIFVFNISFVFYALDLIWLSLCMRSGECAISKRIRVEAYRKYVETGISRLFKIADELTLQLLNNLPVFFFIC